MAKQREHGDGGLRLRGRIWWILYRVSGKQYQKSTKGTFNGIYNDGTSKEVALSMLREELTDTGRGAVPSAEIDKLSYESIRESYLKLNPEQEKYYGLQHLDKFFKDMAVPEITTNTIEDFIDYRRDEDEVSDPTIRRNLVCLRAMFNLARKKGQLGQRDVPYFPMPDDSEAAGQYIAPADFVNVKSHLPESLRPFFQFMYSTACRLGALQKITWDMVSADCTEINLPGSITKSKKPLLIVLAGAQLDPIAAMLRKMFRNDARPVFDSTNYRPEWAKACAKAGVGTWDQKTRTRTGVRIHDCRCSAAINLIDSGVDRDIVLTIGGWRTDAMLRRYNVINKDRLKAAAIKGGLYVAAKEKSA